MSNEYNLWLADDDEGDRETFRAALKELPITFRLTLAENGQHLMDMLAEKEPPDALFLDLTMPLKSGIACLSQIKANPRLKKLQIIIFTSSYYKDLVEQLYMFELQYYIQKPANFEILKQSILKSLQLLSVHSGSQPMNDFVIYHQ